MFRAAGSLCVLLYCCHFFSLVEFCFFFLLLSFPSFFISSFLSFLSLSFLFFVVVVFEPDSLLYPLRTLTGAALSLTDLV